MYFGVCTCVNARVERSVQEPVRMDACADSTGTGLAGRAPSITYVRWPGQSAGRGDRTWSGAAPPAKFMVARLSQRGRMCVQDSEGAHGRERMMRTLGIRGARFHHPRSAPCGMRTRPRLQSPRPFDRPTRPIHCSDCNLFCMGPIQVRIPKFMWTWSVVHPST